MSALRTAALGAAGQLSLGSLFVRLTLDAAQFTRGWGQAQATMTGSAATMMKAAVGMAAAVGVAMTTMGGLSAREAIRFESSFAGIRKTVNATEEEFQKLEKQMRQMGKEIPINVNELNKVAEWAGQLGIKTENIISFTRVMADMGVTTNLSAESAAKSMARLANIMQTPQTEFQRMGSVIVELGNNLATTEEEILNMALRIAGSGKLVGMAEHQVLGLSAALSSLGIRAELGGSSVSRMMRDMHTATFEGGQKLAIFAQTVQMSSAQFVQAFREDAAGTITSFIEGLSRISDAGGDVTNVLDKLGLDTIRLTDVILRSVGAGDTYAKTFRMAAQAAKDNNALTIEAAKRYATLESQLKITWGLIRDIAITVGNELMPVIRALNNMLQGTLKDADNMNSSFGTFVKSVAPAFIFVITKIGDIIQGWRLIIKSGELAFLSLFSFVLNTVSNVAESIRSLVEGIINGIISGVNKAIGALNKLLPKSKELSEVGKITLGKTEGAQQVEDWAKALSEAVAESSAELEAMASKGSFSDQFQKEYEKVTTVVKTENKKIVADVEETAKKAVAIVAPMSDRLRKALADLEASTTQRVEQPTLGADLEDSGKRGGRGGRGSSVLGQFEDPMIDTMNRLSEERALVEENLALLEELGAHEVSMTEAVQQKKLELTRAYNDKLYFLQIAQAQLVIQISTGMFDSLTKIAEGTAGKQSGIYKTMFAASKAFAIADATVQIASSIAKAANASFPASLVFMASAAAATASIVSSIQAVNLEFGGGRESGGPVGTGKSYLVGEAGPEMFVPGAAGKIIPNDAMGGRDVKVIVHNYSDGKAEVSSRNEGGEQVIEVVIKRVKNELTSEVRDGRGDFNRALSSSFNLKRGKR